MDDLFPGTWYLMRVDDKHRREYARQPLDEDLPTESELNHMNSSTTKTVEVGPEFCRFLIAEISSVSQ